MSLPSFPGDQGGQQSSPGWQFSIIPSPGAGSKLPVWLLALCGTFTAISTAVSIMSITLQLKNYRKPPLQRAVVRIMVMVPLYAISSLIAIFSLEAAFFIDAVRDLYEAFVIYTFFQLLITYLGGERSLLIILHGRPPIPHPFPVNLFLAPMDVSDPWTLLNLKRGVLQYVQIKPLLVVATVILKLTGTYREGKFAVDSGYTYVSIVYNTSICLSLYCLAMFWVCVSKDLKPFRPVPKFLCVKGILFFSFWQSIAVSLLVAVGAIKKVGVYTDAEHMSLALVDSLICFEMPIFAIAHQYAFRASDYIDDSLVHAARLPFIYAFRDAFGLKDVWQDTKDTFKGRGVSYQAYEPAEGGIHYGRGRQKRIRAGLRYAKGGKAKYWIPIPGDENRSKGEMGPVARFKRRIKERINEREAYAPLLPKQAAHVVHPDPEDPNVQHHHHTINHQNHGTFETTGHTHIFDSDSDDSDAPSLDFDSVNEDEENLYERARRIGYAGFPNVDVSKEAKRRKRREEEDGILQGKWTRERPGMSCGRTNSDHSRTKGKGKAKDEPKKAVYGAWADRANAGDGKRNGHAGANGLPNGDATHTDDGKSSMKGKNGKVRWSDKSQSQSSQPKPQRPASSRHNSSNSPFAIGDDESIPSGSVSPASRPLPPDAIDLVVDDPERVDEARVRGRQRGEPQKQAPVHVYLHKDLKTGSTESVEEVYEDSADVAGQVPISESMEEEEMPAADLIKRLEKVDERGLGSDATPYEEEDNPWR